MTPLWWMLAVALRPSPSVDTALRPVPVAGTERIASGPRREAAFPTFQPVLAAPAGPRPRVIEHSDFYYTRLTVHRWASYAIVPAFVTEAVLGQSLYNNPPGSSGTRTAHSVAAIGVIGLFGLNTVTGVWNLWDSRHDPGGKARRYLHAALMLAADAGFVATEASAPGRRRVARDPSSRTRHRTLALTSMGVALTGYAIMLIWK